MSYAHKVSVFSLQNREFKNLLDAQGENHRKKIEQK